MHACIFTCVCIASSRSNRALADSLEQAVDPQDPLVNKLMRMMATQAMSNALYFSTGACPEEQYYHYGTCFSFCHHYRSFVISLLQITDAIGQIFVVVVWINILPCFKGIVHPKMKISSSFTHPHVVTLTLMLRHKKIWRTKHSRERNTIKVNGDHQLYQHSSKYLILCST